MAQNFSVTRLYVHCTCAVLEVKKKNEKLGYSLIYKKSTGWCLTGSNLCKWKKTKKDGWSCRWQSSRLSLIWGSSWRLEIHRALFPAPHPPLPTPLHCDANAGDSQGRPIQAPITLQRAVLGLGHVKTGSSESSYCDKEVWWETISLPVETFCGFCFCFVLFAFLGHTRGIWKFPG